METDRQLARPLAQSPSTPIMSDPSSAPSACPPKPAQMKKASSGKKPQKITQFKQLRGRPDEPLATRISKTLSYLLRHGAEKQALPMRQDGWLTVDDLVRCALCS